MTPSTERALSRMLADSPRKLTNLLRAQDFVDRSYLIELFHIADHLERSPSDCLRGQTLLWYGAEASTRTRLSFATAMRKLGGTVESVSSSDSSSEKGESIEDTVLSIATMTAADIIVLRHPDEDAIWRAARVCPISLINGGSGAVHHPSQAALDVFTIHRSGKTLDNLTVAVVGDLKYARTANSFVYLLTKFSGVTLYLVSPSHLRMKAELVYYLGTNGVRVIETTDLESIIGEADVVYQTRAQKERSTDGSEHRALSSYVLDRKMVGRMKKDAIILHPLPRNEELPREVDELPQAKYIRQMYYGQLIRQALLVKILHP